MLQHSESIDQSESNEFQAEIPTTENQGKNRLHPKHLKYWTERGVSEEIIRLNVRSLFKDEEIAALLRWKKWFNGSGWVVTGIDPETGERTEAGLQFRPDTPRLKKDSKGNLQYDAEGNPKIQKFESRKGVGSTPLFLEVGDREYWQKVLSDETVPVFLTEGAAKAGCLLSHGMPTISLPGVCNGQKLDRIDESLGRFCVSGRKVYLVFDADWSSNRNVRQALERQAALIRSSGAIPYIVNWDALQGKGCDDFVVSNGIEAFKNAVDAAPTFKEWIKQHNVEPSKKAEATTDNERRSIIPVEYTREGKPILPKASTVANALLERYRDCLIWSIETKRFFRYGVEMPGLWTKEPSEQLKAEIASELDKSGLGYSSSFVNSVLELIGNRLSLKCWQEPKDLIPMTNGVLNRLDMRLLPHDPKYRFRWQLPYGFTEDTNCKPILDWLLEAMEGHQDRVDVLLAYLKAIVTSRVDLQRFLELVGEGGTGKGTFIRIATALVGKVNTLPTNLKQLEGNRFETASLYGKRLATITDSESYAGDISTLKALTGQDLIRYELKGIQQGDSADAGFYPDAMVIIATNKAIKTLDHSSGIQRRRLTIPFNRQPESSDRRDLLSLAGDTIRDEFAPYLPALLTHILLIPDERVTELVRDTDKHCPSLREAVRENFIETNPLAEWLDSCLVVVPGSKVYVGSAKKIRRTEGVNQDGSVSTSSWDTYQNADSWLYANYKRWCDGAGKHSVAVSVQSFSKQLISLCKAQLKIQGIEKANDRNGAFITGLAIRSDEHEDFPRPVTGQKNDPVMDSVMDCDGSVVAETLTRDGFDECDGFFENSREIEKSHDLTESYLIDLDDDPHYKEKVDKLPQKPSHSSQIVAHKGFSHHESITQPSQSITSAFKVGDRVRSTKANPSRPVYGIVEKVYDNGELSIRLEADLGTTRREQAAYWLLSPRKSQKK